MYSCMCARAFSQLPDQFHNILVESLDINNLRPTFWSCCLPQCFCLCLIIHLLTTWNCQLTRANLVLSLCWERCLHSQDFDTIETVVNWFVTTARRHNYPSTCPLDTEKLHCPYGTQCVVSGDSYYANECTCAHKLNELVIIIVSVTKCSSLLLLLVYDLKAQWMLLTPKL